MQKSKLFSDVHVSVPHAAAPASALSQAPIVPSTTPAIKVPNAKQKWLIIGGCLFMAVLATSTMMSTGSSKPKVVVVKAPAAFSTTDNTAANNAALAEAMKRTASTVQAATAPMAQTIASQATELANLKQQLELKQQEMQQLVARTNARIVPTATASSPSASTYSPPVPIDQHGVLLTVNGRPFQCSAREGAPVCVSIGGYIQPRNN